jgi:hypothetical protein
VVVPDESIEYVGERGIPISSPPQSQREGEKSRSFKPMVGKSSKFGRAA